MLGDPSVCAQFYNAVAQSGSPLALIRCRLGDVRWFHNATTLPATQPPYTVRSTSKKIQCLLAGSGPAKYAQVCRDNDIYDEVLADLDDADLKEVGVSLGHRKKILKAIVHAPDAQPPRPKAALVNATE